MKKRYLPFGYEIKNGMIQQSPSEAPVVSMIFEMYANGATLLQIAKRLTAHGVKYRGGCAVWDKHIVRRILECEKYCGAGHFPALIERAQYDLAYAVRASKRSFPAKEIALVRKRMACSRCGQRMYLLSATDQWECRGCGWKSGRIPHGQLLGTVQLILKELRRHSEDLRAPQSCANSYSLSVSRLAQEIKRGLQQKEADIVYLTERILERCAAQYEVLDVGEYDPPTLRIRELFEKADKDDTDELNDVLFEQTVDKILLSADGKIRLQLINGQIFPVKKEPAQNG